MAELENVSGSTPADATSQQPPAAATSAVPASQVATPPVTPFSATTEDRSTWVPPHRLRETRESAIREAQTQFAHREAEIRAEAQRYKEQVQRLVGVGPQQDPEVDAVRQQFGKLYPGLAKMEDKVAALEQLLERAGDLESVTNHHWNDYGRQTIDRLFTQTQTALGAPLSEDGKKTLHSMFVGYVQQSPEMVNRYTNDPTIVDDFVRAITSNLVDPARRAASATVQTRTGSTLPQDSGSGALPVAPSGPKPTNLDERAAQGWALWNNRKA
jgi:hypothetical protein